MQNPPRKTPPPTRSRRKQMRPRKRQQLLLRSLMTKSPSSKPKPPNSARSVRPSTLHCRRRHPSRPQHPSLVWVRWRITNIQPKRGRNHLPRSLFMIEISNIKNFPSISEVLGNHVKQPRSKNIAKGRQGRGSADPTPRAPGMDDFTLNFMLKERVPFMDPNNPPTEQLYILPLPWKKLTVSGVPWANFSDPAFGIAGCGPCMLGQLTFTNPFEIKTLLAPAMKKYFPQDVQAGLLRGTHPKLMQEYLRLFGIYMLPIVKGDIYNHSHGPMAHITEHHVILTASRVTRQEMTWCMFHNHKEYHVTDRSDATILHAFNWWQEQRYLLFSPKWVVKSSGLNVLAAFEEAEE